MNEACQHTHRNYQVDNIRAFLIFLVVLGHLIPLNNGGINSNPLYSVIYSFHMALFVFVNGIYARFDRKKILKHYIIMRDAGIRLILEAIGLAWIVLLFAAIPDRPIKLITTIGQNTMPIYLLHGFIAKYVSKCNLLHYGRMENEIIATIAAMMIVIVLGNRQIGRIFRKLF